MCGVKHERYKFTKHCILFVVVLDLREVGVEGQWPEPRFRKKQLLCITFNFGISYHRAPSLSHDLENTLDCLILKAYQKAIQFNSAEVSAGYTFVFNIAKTAMKEFFRHVSDSEALRVKLLSLHGKLMQIRSFNLFGTSCS